MTVTTLSLHRSTDPYGLTGGEAGARGRNRIERADGSIEELADTDGAEMAPGDLFRMETPGGGGYSPVSGEK